MDKLRDSVKDLTAGIRKFSAALTAQVDEWHDEEEIERAAGGGGAAESKA